MSKKKLNFRIIDGSEFDQESFNKDYIDLSKSRKELMEKYNLSDGQWTRKSRHARNETGFSRRRGVNIDPENKYITKSGNRFRVQKGTHGFTRGYGTFKDLKTARMVRDILESCDWNDEVAKECRELYGSGKRCTDANQYIGSPITREALKKYTEFKKLYLSGRYSYQEILDKLNFTNYQYTICRNKLKQTYPNIRKKMVKNI